MGTSACGAQNVVADVLSRNPVGIVDGSQISCAVLRALALNSREQLIHEQWEDPELRHIYRYLENLNDGSVNANVCEGWSQDFKLIDGLLFYAKYCTTIGELRVYIPQSLREAIMHEFHDQLLAGHLGKKKTNSDTNSFDSINETLYEGKGSSKWSNRSHSGKSRRSRKPSGNESKSCKSNKGTAGLEDLRFKRNKPVMSTGTSERYDRKRPKICRKRSLQGSEYKDTKRKAPVLPQGLKRGVPSSISSRTRKYIRNSFNEHPSQGPETLSGTSNQQQRWKFSPPKEESRRGARVQSDRAREIRTTGSRGHSAAEGRPVRSGKTTTVRPCPYYLKSLFKEPEGGGLQEEHWDRQSTAEQPQEKEPQHRSFRRRSG
ncbi:uncharacterized protein TNCV_2030531 [Trichonephila clavipes]|nr:uncharacterized protein TNCV_2030531 [Trichonephila clavipes]